MKSSLLNKSGAEEGLNYDFVCKGLVQQNATHINNKELYLNATCERMDNEELLRSFSSINEMYDNAGFNDQPE